VCTIAITHYQIPAIYRVPKAHGEGPKTHGIHVRRARPTANPRRRPNTTAKPASPCAFYRAHGKDLSRVFGPANGKLEHMTAGTATGDGNGARRRRWIRSSPCTMDPGTRQRFELRRVPDPGTQQRFKKIKKDSVTAAARHRRHRVRPPPHAPPAAARAHTPPAASPSRRPWLVAAAPEPRSPLPSAPSGSSALPRP